MLGYIGDDDALSALCEALRDEDEIVRARTVRALADFGPRAPVQLILDRLGDNSAVVRANVPDALRKIGGAAAVGGLVQALEDPDATVRQEAVRELENVGDPAAMPALAELLRKEAEGQVRRFAPIALSRMAQPAAVTATLPKFPPSR